MAKGEELIQRCRILRHLHEISEPTSDTLVCITRVAFNAGFAFSFSSAQDKLITEEVRLQHAVASPPAPPFSNLIISSLRVRPEKNSRRLVQYPTISPIFTLVYRSKRDLQEIAVDMMRISTTIRKSYESGLKKFSRFRRAQKIRRINQAARFCCLLPASTISTSRLPPSKSNCLTSPLTITSLMPAGISPSQ
ncbi:hypothetical protein RvY_06269 [Ramazzottius varieornatus]|uniref:Uncharacterized protein n=1 Tax=Ramazzottius varieornatus TaxID=947166 RepID=A0A1D1UXY5_RAMVA|nr:hypothetical protein RvY_06269 [Ramazzottius varieornatus]